MKTITDGGELYGARPAQHACSTAGGEIDPRQIDWNSDRAPNFTIRQDSGAWNALGAVRIDMPNPYSVYMHDTSHKELFSADYRFQSSGCTRVENPRDLAAWLLEDNPGWSRREIDAAIAKGQRTDVRLTHKVPVAWVYLTGWTTRDGLIHFRDDVYHHDEKPALVADARPQVASAARASGFVLQSADTRPGPVSQVSYLDSQSEGERGGRMIRSAIALAVAMAAAVPALANDSSAELTTGGLVFVRNDNVEMQSEDLRISAKEIHVRYRFFNKSDKPVTVLVAFPMPEIKVDEQDQIISVPTEDPVNFLAFTTTVNGQPVVTKVEQRVSPPASTAPSCCARSGFRWRRTWPAPTRRSTGCRRTSGTSCCGWGSPRSRNTTPARA